MELGNTLLAGILAAQVVQLGFEATLLRRVASLRTKVQVMWNVYTGNKDTDD